MATITTNGKTLREIADDKKAKKAERQLTLGNFSDVEQKLIREHIDERRAEAARFGIGRGLHVINALATWKRFIKVDFQNATIKDLYSAINAARDSRLDNGRGYAGNTLNSHEKSLKHFYYWMARKGYTAVTEAELNRIKVTESTRINKKPEQVLSNDQINALIAACRCDRDRAFISVLYHSGGRVSEVLEMKWGDLKVDLAGSELIGYELVLHGTKTAKSKDKTVERGLYLPKSTAQMLNIHKSNSSPAVTDADHVWLQNRADKSGEQMAYDTAAALMKRISKSAGFKAHLHLLRTSRITNWVKEGFPETTICMAAWGRPHSNMYNTYVRLAGTYAIKSMKSKINVDLGPEEKQPEIKPDTVKCWHCKNDIPGYSVFCPICGRKPDGSDYKAEKAESAEIQAIRAEYDAKLNDIMAQVALIAKSRSN